MWNNTEDIADQMNNIPFITKDNANLKQAIQIIFPSDVPLTTTWTDKCQIINMLNSIGGVENQ